MSVCVCVCVFNFFLSSENMFGIIQIEKQPNIVAGYKTKTSLLHLIELTALRRKAGRSTRTEQKKTDTRHWVPTTWKRVGYAM